MTDWKSCKDSGPWPFVRQRTKWGYLNNPRWAAIARKFIRGGQDDYTMRESQEPQIWTPPVQGVNYSVDAQKIHHECGHWHTPQQWPSQRYWQQALDVNGNTITYLGRSYSLPSLAYEGALAGFDISWQRRLTYESANQSNISPVRVVERIPNNVIVSYDLNLTDNWETVYHTAFIYDGAIHEHPLANYMDTWDSPIWESIDIHTSGLAVAIDSYTNYGSEPVHGPRIFVSTDFGTTWTGPLVIDYLYNLLGETIYNAHALDGDSYSIQVDEYTGIFYILIHYWATAGWNNHKFSILKSTNGINWSHVHTWDDTAEILTERRISLAVSNNYLYWSTYKYTINNHILFHSSNGGVDWTETVLTTPYTDYNPTLAANGSILIAYQGKNNSYTPFQNGCVVLRSSDGGNNFIEVVDTNFPNVAQYTTYQVCRASRNTFVFTFCNFAYPNVGSWHDKDGITHSMVGAGQPYLAFFLSRDNGLTWVIKTVPMLPYYY